MPQENKKELMLEERKVKALEKIANIVNDRDIFVSFVNLLNLI